jgi:hypothetical protein
MRQDQLEANAVLERKKAVNGNQKNTESNLEVQGPTSKNKVGSEENVSYWKSRRICHT